MYFRCMVFCLLNDKYLKVRNQQLRLFGHSFINKCAKVYKNGRIKNFQSSGTLALTLLLHIRTWIHQY